MQQKDESSVENACMYNDHTAIVLVIFYIIIVRLTLEFTCSEFKIVNNHAKTVVFSLIASTPIIQVTPSKGNRINVLFRADLYYHYKNYHCNIHSTL